MLQRLTGTSRLVASLLYGPGLRLLEALCLRVAGLVLYAVVTPFLRGFLYGVTAADPVALSGATAALLATASLATWLPARRAARVDTAVALRAE